jgi:hypothetical protein
MRFSGRAVVEEDEIGFGYQPFQGSLVRFDSMPCLHDKSGIVEKQSLAV